jgi:hypothetical protein
MKFHRQVPACLAGMLVMTLLGGASVLGLSGKAPYVNNAALIPVPEAMMPDEVVLVTDEINVKTLKVVAIGVFS